MISQALRRHQSTIIRHLDDYRAGKLTLSSGGSDSHLSEQHTEELIQHLEEHIPAKDSSNTKSDHDFFILVEVIKFVTYNSS